jgi:hypothetical protein
MTILQAIAEGWGWKLGKPVEVVAINAFGNAIVVTKDGKYYRIVPEELQCSVIATSRVELDEARSREEFLRDWQMTPLVSRAETALGRLSDGECYYLVVPGVLGGKYAEENIRKISLIECLRCSGDMARQIDKMPDGTKVQIKIK